MSKTESTKPATLTKGKLVDAVSEALKAQEISASKVDIGKVISSIFDSIKTEIISGSDGKYVQHCFGTFEVRQRNARTGCNPRNRQETIQIPASKVVGLKVSQSLKDSLNP